MGNAGLLSMQKPYGVNSASCLCPPDPRMLRIGARSGTTMYAVLNCDAKIFSFGIRNA